MGRRHAPPTQPHFSLLAGYTIGTAAAFAARCFVFMLR